MESKVSDSISLNRRLLNSAYFPTRRSNSCIKYSSFVVHHRMNIGESPSYRMQLFSNLINPTKVALKKHVKVCQTVHSV